MDKKITCCFTGHRPQKLPFGYNENDIQCIYLKKILKNEIIRIITKYCATHFISGMALGIDTYAAEIILELKKEWKSITLECAIPCESQSARWREKDRDRYFNIIELSDKKTLLQKPYEKNCMDKRNKYMVDNSDYIIAVWNGKPSGTGKTVNYAQSQAKTVIIINPNNVCGAK